MHIAEGILPPIQSALWFCASAPFIVHGAKRVVDEVKKRPENTMLLAAAGAFTFVLSAIKLPSISGSSSHPTGTGAGAILFRPPVMAFMATIVLLFQALLLAHGGITSLGANAFSMAIVGPWAAYGVWVLARRLGSPMVLGVFLAIALSNLATYAVTALQLAIAFPDPGSGLLGAAGKFLSIFAFTQIPLSIAEGIVGVLLFRFLGRVAAPQLVRMGVLKGSEVKQDEEVAAHA